MNVVYFLLLELFHLVNSSRINNSNFSNSYSYILHFMILPEVVEVEQCFYTLQVIHNIRREAQSSL